MGYLRKKAGLTFNSDLEKLFLTETFINEKKLQSTSSFKYFSNF